MGEKQALEDDAASCQRRMSAATQLIEGLSGEKVRWTMQSQQFQSQINRLVGDVLLATGFLSYTGPFNQEFRNLLIKDRWISEMDERSGAKSYYVKRNCKVLQIVSFYVLFVFCSINFSPSKHYHDDKQACTTKPNIPKNLIKKLSSIRENPICEVEPRQRLFFSRWIFNNMRQASTKRVFYLTFVV